MSTAQAAATGSENSAPPIRTIAGTGAANSSGDNGPALHAQLNRPLGIVVDGNGVVCVSENTGHRVRKITTDGRISTLAGTGAPGTSGDNGPAVSAQLYYPRDLAVDDTGAVYIVDHSGHRIRKMTADGKISTVAGTGAQGYGGDDGPATAARLNSPTGVAVDSTGTLYITDYANHRVRKVTADGKISTVAGTGTQGYGGDDGPATAAQLSGPHGVAVDSTGTLYIADYGNHRVRRVTADGKISTVAGTGSAGYGGDDGPATAARLNAPVGVAVDSTGTLYIADYSNHRVRKVTTGGKISTVAGTGAAGVAGDGGPPTSAQLSGPYGLAVDCVDTLYIVEHNNNRVRKITSGRMAGLPESGTVVSWANVRSRLRIAVARESVKDGAEIQQMLAVPRDHQRWRLVAAGQDNGDVLYRFENVRSGKVLEVVGAQERAGAVLAQRAYEGADAHHQQWRLIPVGSANGSPRVYEIANRNSGLLLRVDTNAAAAIRQDGADGDHHGRQWQLLPV
ncbi:RICIN domain-containing protein [Streptomyces sp. NPDC048514]|uniref:NHL domain-containing protein n=1 Tax=Streptomyces sp. NPDC048514 TaxID=3365564 RepID=UPI00371BB6C3